MEQLANSEPETEELFDTTRDGSPPLFVSRTVGLGLFSLGLGLAEVLAPQSLARLIGVKTSRQSCRVLQALGAREIANGIGLLVRPKSAVWVWARVAGDIMDLALLGDTLFSARTQHARLAGAAAAVVGVTAVDAVSAAHISRQSTRPNWSGVIQVSQSITINRSASEVYDYWRDLENLPRFMSHLEHVHVINGTSKWKAKGPAGLSIEWDAEVILDQPNESIAWRSLKGTAVPNQGVVRFKPAPGNRGTEVSVNLQYEPPAGALGAAFAKLFGEEPSQQIAGDLRRLKQVLETGEVVHSDASIHGGMHAARPSEQSNPITKGGQSK
ncbi:MAG TPA: SRPBCC family protein [Polyangiaceae bacterium]|nr:SRPBCC family protein [Polyangiaceae bacterium]